MKIIPYKLACAMANIEITAGELCKRTNLSSKSIANYINGKSSARPIVVGKIAKAVNVTPEYLTKEAGENNAE